MADGQHLCTEECKSKEQALCFVVEGYRPFLFSCQSNPTSQCASSKRGLLLYLCVYRIIQFPRPVKFKEVVQKVTDAFGQTMDLVCVYNEVLFSLLQRGSFRVPGDPFRTELCSKGPNLVLYMHVEKNTLVLWFPPSKCVRAVVWTWLSWNPGLQASSSFLKIISIEAH